MISALLSEKLQASRVIIDTTPWRSKEGSGISVTFVGFVVMINGKCKKEARYLIYEKTKLCIRGSYEH